MSSSHTSSRVRSKLIAVLGVCVTVIVYMFAFEVLDARQEGMGVAAAVHSVLPHLPRMLPPILPACAVGVLFALLSFGRQPAGAGSPIEAGRVVWRRLRFWTTVVMASLLLMAAGVMFHDRAKGQWGALGWVFAVMFVIFTAQLIAQWVKRPSSERLYTLGTGDSSRLNDERSQQVRGKVANTTLTIFTIVLLMGGVVYETVVLGTEPVLTGAELLVLGLIWTIATIYWNRRL
jgi:hypothetical protein